MVKPLQFYVDKLSNRIKQALRSPLDLDMGSKNIKACADPVDAQDVVTKAYGDANYAGVGDSLQTVASAGAAQTIDCNTANYWDVTFDAVNCTLTFTKRTGETLSAFVLVIHQDAIGGRGVTWPASVKWPGGVVPALSAGINAIDVFSFITTDGGTSWLGDLMGNAFA